MKFRNPKTGDILEDYVSFRGDFCCEYMCEDCPVGRTAKNGLCEKFVKEHPYEAAAMMGYEVVEDDATMAIANGIQKISNAAKESTKIIQDYLNKWKEDNMDKPRICEVLGVEVGEVWTFDNDPTKFRICADGHREYYHSGRWLEGCAEFNLCDVINHPERIIHKPRWTEQEAEDAKTLLRIFPEQLESISRANDGTVTLEAKGAWRAHLNSDAFPSILPGQSYTLDEIIGGAE